MMTPDEAAADISEAMNLVRAARDDVSGLETDACNWPDTGTVEDAAVEARQALDALYSALDSALAALPDEEHD